MRLSFVFADEDPVNTAQWYGWANTAMWTVMPRLEEWIHIPDPHIHMEMDFTAAETKVSGTVGASYRIGDLLAIGFAAAGPVLKFGILTDSDGRNHPSDHFPVFVEALLK